VTAPPATAPRAGASPLGAFSRVVVLCAHTDDEFGCAGTVARLIEQGADVRYVALSRCEESVPSPYPRDVLEHECRECTARMGIAPDAVSVLGFPVRYFPEHRQAILETLVRIAREYRPELVLLPSSFDTHQDHATVFNEGFRAFKHSTILGYEMPQNLISFSHSAFVELTREQLERKIHALESYRSQSFRPYSTAEFIRGLAAVRGVQCNAAYAEAFEVVRLILR
jgi:N-acetylglucosamine malate deacetylase 1